MPYNGQGTFTPKHIWVNEAAAGTPMLPANFDDQDNDIAAALSNTITRDGQGSPTSDIPWNNYGITGMRDPVQPQEAATKNYVDTVDAATRTWVRGTTTALPVQSKGFLVSDGNIASWSQSLTGYALNECKGADIPSAATINLTAATGNFVHVTGNTAITAITIPVGAERTVVFDGSLTLTNSAALILPGGANITTQPGDSMRVRGDTAGALVVSYSLASGRTLLQGGFTNLLVISSTQTWQPPIGTTKAEITVIDGGQSSGTSTSTWAPGGNGGAASVSVRTVSSLVTYTATVGAAGVAAAAGTNTSPAAGGTSSFSGSGLTLTSANGDLKVPGGLSIGLGSSALAGTSLYAPATAGSSSGYGAGAPSVAANAAGISGKAGVIIIRY